MDSGFQKFLHADCYHKKTSFDFLEASTTV